MTPPSNGSVQLLATCLGDLFFPDAVRDAKSLIEMCGYKVRFPEAQVCCGQPAFNAGHVSAARRVARTFTRAFDRDTPIVAASGSCAAMVAHRLPELVGCDHYPIVELSEFLDRHDVALNRVNASVRLSYHESCHMARELGILDTPRRLLERTGATIAPLPRPDLCCGFGGTFSVRQPEVSIAMADDKLAVTDGAEAIVTADPGCLMQLRSRAAVTKTVPVVALSTALLRGVRATDP